MKIYFTQKENTEIERLLLCIYTQHMDFYLCKRVMNNIFISHAIQEVLKIYKVYLRTLYCKRACILYNKNLTIQMSPYVKLR